MMDNKMITEKTNNVVVEDSIRMKASTVLILMLAVAVVTMIAMLAFAGSVLKGLKGNAASSFLTVNLAQAPKIDIQQVNQKIRELGELTTAEISYEGMLRYDQGSIPFITKHGFLMTYSAYIRAGIDFSGVKVRLQGDTVKVSIPEAQVQVLYVDPESISFYDESHALFEGDGKDHLKTALTYAETDARDNFDKGVLLSKANMVAEEMIYDLVEKVVGDVDVEIERR